MFPLLDAAPATSPHPHWLKQAELLPHTQRGKWQRDENGAVFACVSWQGAGAVYLLDFLRSVRYHIKDCECCMRREVV
jgi:hypothetical protein